MGKTLKMVKVWSDEDETRWEADRSIRFSIDEIFDLRKVSDAASEVTDYALEVLVDEIEKQLGASVEADESSGLYEAYAIVRLALYTGPSPNQEMEIELPDWVEVVNDGADEKRTVSITVQEDRT